MIKANVMPNLFNYATSELSQDAVICYLLEWASPSNEELDSEMHSLGLNFLHSLWERSALAKPSEGFKNIDIKKQYKNIDVLCIVNDIYPIIIEDKTHSSEHSEQLKRYFDEISQEYLSENIIPIYFKTGDQSHYPKTYHLFHRTDFLNILNAYKGNNEIVCNYRSFLQKLEGEVNSYKTLALNDWTYQSWIGFYKALQDSLGEEVIEWWGMVVPRGQAGYLSLSSKRIELETGVSIYWEIKGKNGLKIVISVEDESRRADLRNKYHQLIINKFPNFRKPARFGTGYTMVIAELSEESCELYEINLDNKLNLASTVKNLININQSLQSLALLKP